MSKEANYFKIGAFTLIAIVVLVVFLVILGIGNLFTRTQLVETYFNESVKGLKIGSSVKYRGVEVGKVDDIDIVNRVYGTGQLPINHESEGYTERYIYVRFSLIPTLPEKQQNQQDAKHMIDTYVAQGLRVSLATQDLVGNVYLELNFVDPKKNPPLPISWKPTNRYIPSARSTLSLLSDTLSGVFSQLDGVDFKKIFNDFDYFLEEDGKLFSQALQDTSSAMKQVDALTARINQLTASQQASMIDTMNSLKQISLNLEATTDKLKNDPSAIVFGEATQSVDPSK